MATNSKVQDYINRSKKTPQVINSGGANTRTTDERFWRMAANQQGNSPGTYVIRFLPSNPSDTEYLTLSGRSSKVEQIEHVFTYFAYHFDNVVEGKKRFYKERSLDTLEYGTDPVAKFNRAMYNLGKKDPKRNMKTVHVVNILVIKDPSDPSNEGKNFLFEFTRDIHNQLVKAINGDEEIGIDPMNPFDIISGRNLAIKFTKEPSTNIRRYDLTFSPQPTAVFNGDEDKLSNLIDNLYSLDEYASPTYYKPLHELIKLLDFTMGFDTQQYLADLGVGGSLKQNLQSTSAQVTPVTPVVTRPEPVKAPPVTVDDDDFDDIPF